MSRAAGLPHQGVAEVADQDDREPAEDEPERRGASIGDDGKADQDDEFRDVDQRVEGDEDPLGKRHRR